MDGLPPTRTLLVTERVPSLVGLAPATADFLLSGWRHAVSLIPTRRRNRYRLTPLGHVGILPAPGVRLVIRPKIPLRNVYFMLDPAASLPAAPDTSEAEPAGPLLDFLAGRFARLMVDRAVAGLHRDYVESREVGPFLRGRLALPEQLLERRAGTLHSVRDELTADVPCNQAVAATAERVILSPLLSPPTRSALRQALNGYAGVQAISAPGELAAPAEYRELLELRRLIEEALTPGQTAGSAAGPAFLLDLGRIFERYVGTAVREAIGEGVRVQPTIQVGGPAGIAIRPDLVVERGGKASAVADTKWKRLPATAADLYQAIAYATALGAGRAVVVFPGRSDRERIIDVGPVRLEVRTVDVGGTPGACRGSLRRLCGAFECRA
jgi:5-methylcytosine-specific restriction enzyme subunit McrC